MTIQPLSLPPRPHKLKSFYQSLFGSLAAFMLVGVGSILAGLVMVVVLAGIDDQPLAELEPGSVLVFNLNTTIKDTPRIDDLSQVLSGALSGALQKETYLLRVLDAIARAKTDSDIPALLLHGSLLQGGYGSGVATISEIRLAIADFKESGKPVYAYLVAPSQKDYYLASVADELWVNPFGEIALNGLAINGAFLGNTLEKFGVGVQTTRVGAYKSAVEQFTRSSMSDADREQKTRLLNELWGSLLEEIAVSRGLSPQGLLKLSRAGAFFTGEKAQAVKLADRVGYLDELIDHLAQSYQRQDSEATFKQIDLGDYAGARGFERDTIANAGERIAVVYAEGEIINGAQSTGYIGGDSLASELRRLRHDTEVKAVVLRVNSPGGSAVASEIIQRETRLLADVKPLVVSMGSYAASGGYWISAYADKIYAQPYSITGSIGVFGLVFNIQQAAENFALQFDGIKTSPFADLYSATRPRSADEMALIQAFTDRIYDAFIDKVAEGRALTVAQVRELAQGRVWTGLSAKPLALIDQFGGLNAAIHEAVNLGDLATLSIEQVPAASPVGDLIARLLDESGVAPVAQTITPLGRIASTIELISNQLQSLNDPRSVYARMPYGLEGL